VGDGEPAFIVPTYGTDTGGIRANRMNCQAAFLTVFHASNIMKKPDENSFNGYQICVKIQSNH